MSFKHLRTLNDYTRHGRRLQVNCLGCGHSAKFRPMVLIALLQSKGWSARLPEVERRLKCSICGGKRVHIGPAI